VNGACAYLDANAGCQIHDRRGSDAKPKGCQLFPLAYVDDGAHINLTVRPECACVFDSLELTPSSPPAGAPPDTPTHLPDWIPVERLPERIIWSTGETVTREAFRERRDAWLHHASPDIARALWEASGNSDDASYTATDSPRSYLKNLHARLGVHQMKRLEWDAPEGHMMRSLGRWRDALGAWLNGEQPLPMPHRDEYERFAFRALAMGTTLTQADSVMNAYQRIALLIWAARILANEPAGRESVSHPLALVFSMTTALGLWETLLS